MNEFIVIFFSMMIFVIFFDFLYVEVGDVFIDNDGYDYQVVEKNLLFAHVVGEHEEKTVPIIFLCMMYAKV